MRCRMLVSEDSPNRINLDRHSSLTDLTQRSAYEFRFGLLAGNRSGFTLAAHVVAGETAQLFINDRCELLEGGLIAAGPGAQQQAYLLMGSERQVRVSQFAGRLRAALAVTRIVRPRRVVWSA